VNLAGQLKVGRHLNEHESIVLIVILKILGSIYVAFTEKIHQTLFYDWPEHFRKPSLNIKLKHLQRRKCLLLSNHNISVNASRKDP